MPLSSIKKKKLWLSLLLSTTFFLSQCPQNPVDSNNPPADQPFVATDSTFEVMTWNIQNFPRNYEVTISAVVKVIRQINVDVIAMQEINDAAAFRQLIDPLPGWSGYVSQRASFDVNLGFLFKSNSSQHGTVTEILTEHDYQRPLPRSPLLLELTWHEQVIYLINNHYKCCGDGLLSSDPWDEERRRYDASLLLDQYVRSNLANANVIILGDFNDELTDNEGNNVFMPFLSRPTEYLFCDLAIAQGSSTYWSYPTYPSHLDHILISNELFDEFKKRGSLIKTILAEKYFTDWNEYAINISDHRPVALKLFF